MKIEQAEFVMTQYGVWCRSQTGVPRYTSPLLALMRDFGAIESHTTVAISDDLALEVDSYLAEMNKDEPELVNYMLWYFIGRYTYRDLARKFGVNHEIVRSGVLMGLASLASCFRTARKLVA